MNFSVDMVRLSVPVRRGDFVTFCNQYVSVHPAVKEYHSFRPKDYRYNYSVEDDFLHIQDYEIMTEFGAVTCNKFYFAYQHNMEDMSASELKKYNLVLEYNPNKCDTTRGLLNKLLHRFFSDEQKVRFVSCDICCDFENLTMDNVVVDMKSKHTFVDYRMNGGRTFYVGKRGSNGQVKIYDKAAEQKMKDKVLTRWEVHLTFDDLYMNMILGRAVVVKECLPTVYFGGGQEKLIEDVKLRCCVMAIKNGTANIREFSRKYREKIEPYLGDTAQEVIDNTNCKELRETIITYCYGLCKELNILQ
ncbi:replication initiation factor domain-containing protein [Anaerotignum propionicum]|uniref:replication initiation factor domain-containing protein n=1 Tax=Anaerotignum propionicum TaxID=28446 RepID=UPI0028A0BED0|nr:replication initiation factor domain-containing protein [Anaerotignum propionicum]